MDKASGMLKSFFTGWEDVNLSEQGINEATRAGEKVRENTDLPSMYS
ncbi:hypothetical protein ACVNPZ_04955 [Staphylococcus aureus]